MSTTEYRVVYMRRGVKQYRGTSPASHAHVRDGELGEETAFGTVRRTIWNQFVPEAVFLQMAETYIPTVGGDDDR